MSRSESLLHRYMASLSYPAVWNRVTEDYEDLEAQRRYLDSLLTSERQTLAMLEESFRVRPQDTSTLEALLMDQKVHAGRVAGVESALGGGLSPAVQSDLKRASTDRASFYAALTGLTGVTKAQFDAARAIGAEQGYTFPDSAFAGTEFVTEAGLLAGLTAEEMATRQAKEAFAQREPSGVVGHDKGWAEIKRRRETTVPNPATSAFSTEQEAFDAALKSLKDGVIARDDFESDEDYAVASDVYAKAMATGAYRNDQKKLFDQTFLEQRRRVAEVEEQAQEVARPAGVTRQQEIFRKQLEARGYDFSKPHVAMQKSKYYKNVVRADELYEAALEAGAAAKGEGLTMFETPAGVVNLVRATTAPQKLARDYVTMMREADKPLDMKVMQRQFRKTLDSDEVDEALGFALAFNRGLETNLQTPTDAQVQLEALRGLAEQQKTREEQAKEAMTRAKDVKEAQLVSEAMQSQDVLAQRAALAEKEAVRAGAATETVDLFTQKYEGYRAFGYTPEEAEQKASEYVRAQGLEVMEPVPVPRRGVPPVAGPIIEQIEAGPDALRFQSDISKMDTDKLFKLAGAGQDIGAVERDLARKELKKRYAGIGLDVTPDRVDELTTTSPEEEAVDLDPDVLVAPVAVQPIAPPVDELAGDPFLDAPAPVTAPAPKKTRKTWNPTTGRFE